jgi:FemAB-related protein (PEP-CTERM system-associated)
MTAAGSTSLRTATLPAQAKHSLKISSLTPADEAEWDQFVLAHTQATAFHLLAWKRTLEDSFEYQSKYLLARDDSGIRAVLPLFYVKNAILGRVLLSTPFAVYGGILAGSIESQRALYEHVKVLAAHMGCDYIEYRNAWPEQCVGTSNVSRYVAFSQQLDTNETALMESLPKKTRNMVRKALKTPFEIRTGVRDPRMLDQVHSRNMRRLGTPNFPLKYFESVLANFRDMADIREVRLNGKVVAVSLNIYFRKDMHTYHAAADTAYNALGPNTFMYYDHLRWAGRNGFETFDFGRCKRNTGVFEFKKHWNTTMRELPYEIVLVKRKELPNFSPANPKFDLPIRIWRKLPLPLTRAASRFVFPLFP